MALLLVLVGGWGIWGNLQEFEQTDNLSLHRIKIELKLIEVNSVGSPTWKRNTLTVLRLRLRQTFPNPYSSVSYTVITRLSTNIAINGSLPRASDCLLRLVTTTEITWNHSYFVHLRSFVPR
jgi:hypothetical protein